LKPLYNIRSRKRQMENEEKAQLETQHQKEVDNLKKEVARLTSLLEQALRDKSGKATLIAQHEPMFVNPFNPQNMGANGLSSDVQQAMHFQPAYPMRMPFTFDSTEKKISKGQDGERRGFGKMDCLRRKDKGS